MGVGRCVRFMLAVRAVFPVGVGSVRSDPSDLDQFQAEALQPIDDAVQRRLVRNRSAEKPPAPVGRPRWVSARPRVAASLAITAGCR